MTEDSFGLTTLAKYLGRDARELQKLAEKGSLPGRRIGGQWRFSRAEVSEWVTTGIGDYSEKQLLAVEEGLRPELDADEMDGGVTPLLLHSLMSADTTAVPFDVRTTSAVLPGLVEIANRTWQVYDPARVLTSVQTREQLCSTALTNGVAMPHLRRPMADALGGPLVAYGRCLSPLPFGGPRGQMTDIFFLVLSTDESTHLQILARLARLLQRDGFVDALREAQTPFDTLDVVEFYEQAISD